MEKSIWSKPGVLSRPLNSVLTPVIAVKRASLSSFTKPGMSRGLVIRKLRPPNFMKTRQFAVSAKMWYSGSAVMMTSSPYLHVGADPRRRLLHVGDEVAVREHRALGHAGGAAGVLQEGDVVRGDLDGRQGVQLPERRARR